MTNETVSITKFEAGDISGADFQITRFTDEMNWSIELFSCFVVEHFDNSKGYICKATYDTKHLVRILESETGELTLALDNMHN